MTTSSRTTDGPGQKQKVTYATAAASAWRSRNRNHPHYEDAIRAGDASFARGPLHSLPDYLEVTREGIVDSEGFGVKAARRFAKDTFIITGRGIVRTAFSYGDDAHAYAMDGAGPKYGRLDLDFSGCGKREANLVKYINSSFSASGSSDASDASPATGSSGDASGGASRGDARRAATRSTTRVLTPNCMICFAGAQLLVYAIQDIEKGDELLVDYAYR